MHKAILLVGVFAFCGQANAQTKAVDAPTTPQSFTAITPIFSQLVMLSYPREFKPAFADTKDNAFYIQESVLAGETVDRWSQMITVTGLKGLAANPNMTAQKMAEQTTTNFRRACPDTLSTRSVGATKISGYDAFIAWGSCGTVQAGTDRRSESVLLVAIKGAADYYTVQWAERAAASSQPMTFDEAKWTGRLKQLAPIKICARVPGEAAPYPSCLNQK